MGSDDQAADWVGIVEVLGRYAAAVDGRQWDSLDDVFTDDVHALYRHVTCTSLAQVKEHVARHLGGVEAAQHLLVNYQIRFDGDTAQSTCTLRAWVAGAGDQSGRTREAFGYYHDDLRKTDDGWRIYRRRMQLVAELGTTDVLKPA